MTEADEVFLRGAAAEALGIGIAVVDDSGRQVYVNPAFARLVGWPRHDLENALPPYRYWPQSEYATIEAAFRATLAGEAPAGGFELRFRDAADRLLDVLVTVSRVEFADGGGWAASVVDISERKREDRIRRKAEADLQLALAASGLGHWDWDMETGAVHWDPRYREIYGILPDVAPDFEIGMSRVHPEDRAAVAAAVAKAAREAGEFQAEMRVIRDGETHWVITRGRVWKDAGTTARMAGVAMDITGRVRAELGERENAVRLALALAHSGLGDWSWEAASDVVTMSERASAIFAIDPGPLLTWEAMRELLHPDDRDNAANAVIHSIDDRTDYDTEYRVRQPNGGWRWVAARGRAIYDEQGTVLRMIGTVQDITERRNRDGEQHLIAELGRILPRNLEPSAMLASFVHFAALRYADCTIAYLIGNDAAVQHFAAAHSDPGASAVLQQLADPEHAGSRFEQVLATFADTNAALPFLHVNDADIAAAAATDEERALLRQLDPASVIVAPLRIDGRLVGMCIFVRVTHGRPPFLLRDVSFCEELTREVAFHLDQGLLFRRAEAANAAKSDFLATMSHELRTPLNAMIGYADLLLMDVPGPLVHEQREFIQRIKASAWQQLELVEGILSFTKIEASQETVQIAPVDLDTLLHDAIELLRPLAERKGLQLECVADKTAAPVASDATKIRQIVINLVGNAIKFTASGIITVQLEVAAAAMISVTDSGPGIDAGKLQLIFEPFVQLEQGKTRSAQGAGLGLTISRRLAHLIGGDITVHSEPGMGATFTLSIPLNPPPV